VSIGDIEGVTGLAVDQVELFLYLSRNLAEALPGVLQTNNRGELLVSLFLSSAEKRGFSTDTCIPQAIIRAIEEHPHPDLPLEIRTDSQYSISCELCRVHSPCEPALSTITNTRPWITRHDPVPPQMATEQFCHIDLLALMNRMGTTRIRLKHVKGHAGHEGNEMADVSRPGDSFSSD
jgi:ribonuclease HI